MPSARTTASAFPAPQATATAHAHSNAVCLVFNIGLCNLEKNPFCRLFSVPHRSIISLYFPEACYDHFDKAWEKSCAGGEWQPRYYYDRESERCRRFW